VDTERRLSICDLSAGTLHPCTSAAQRAGLLSAESPCPQQGVHLTKPRAPNVLKEEIVASVTVRNGEDRSRQRQNLVAMII